MSGEVQRKAVEDFFAIADHELQTLRQRVPVKNLETAKEMILQAESANGRVHVTGIGKPSYVAGYVASLLSSTGTPSYFLDGTEAIHGSSGQVKAGDVVIAISNSGETEELKKTILTLQNNGAKIIGVTGNENSWLAKHADCFLSAGVGREGDKLNKPPRVSILAELLILQGLSVLLQEAKDLTPQKYLRWHPGGALGEAIRKEHEV